MEAAEFGEKSDVLPRENIYRSWKRRRVVDELLLMMHQVLNRGAV